MLKDNKVLAIIPARGSHDEVDHLNIKLLAGKPLISYAIKNALKSKYIERLIVSTEDPKVAQISKEHGAEVPFLRPAELCNEDVALATVIRHVLTNLRSSADDKFDIIVTLLPNSPFRTDQDIDSAIELFNEHNYDRLISVEEIHDFFWVEKMGKLVPFTHEADAIQKKQSIPLFRERGGICIARRWLYEPGWSRKIKLGNYVMNGHNATTINSLYDLYVSERLAHLPKQLIHDLFNSN